MVKSARVNAAAQRALNITSNVFWLYYFEYLDIYKTEPRTIDSMFLGISIYKERSRGYQ